MKTTIKMLLAGAMMLTLAACSKERVIERRLEGTWNVDKYEFVDPSGNSISTANVGTIEFMEGGTGRYNTQYTYGSTTVVRSESMRWSNTDETVTIIDSDGDAETWTIDDNSRKTQVWYRLDSDGDRTVMTMTKK